jgi:hypothetical protein
VSAKGLFSPAMAFGLLIRGNLPCWKSLLYDGDCTGTATVNSNKIANSLLVAAVNVVLASIAFALFTLPRFTAVGGLLSLLILLLFVFDIVLVLRDLWSAGTRGRAVVAVLLWLPILFLFAMMNQWEGPLYVAVNGNPTQFQVRGLAMFCGLQIYSREQDNSEWYGDDIGLIWAVDHTPGRFPFEANFKYGQVPFGFVQKSPTEKLSPPSLDPNVDYKLEVDRCMGGAQYFSLRGQAITEYKSNSDACWGQLKVPERENAALVRVDCKTLQPLPMSKRAEERLKAYREKRIPFY